MPPDPLLAFVRQAYRSEHTRLVERHRNPHLDHACTAPQYEVQAECHPEHQVIELATVEYAPSGDQCLVAITTCGDFAVWMD